MEFFDDPFALATLIFARDQTQNFQTYILRLEGDHICAIDALNIINELKTNVKSRLNNDYYSQDFRDECAKIQNSRLKRKFLEKTKEFHRVTLTYLNEWTEWLNDVAVFSWVSLKNKVKWNDVECAALWMTGRNYFSAVDMDKLFNQFSIMEAYVKQNEASLKEKTIEEKWIEIFRHFEQKSVSFTELLKVVEFSLVIPATNATVERVFSHINDIWTSDKGNMKIENVRARLMTKFNWTHSCLDFYNKIKDDDILLRKVMGNDKYNTQNDLFNA